MSKSNTTQGPSLLRQLEMVELIKSEKNPITSHLMEMSYQVLFLRVLTRKKAPIADFDLLYFMEVMQDFCGEHETLRKILAGEGGELVMIPDDSTTKENDAN